VTDADSVPHPATDASGVGQGSSAGKAIIAAAVLGSALAYMSDDMLNVALPTVSTDIAVGVTEMQWVVNGHFVTMLSLMLTAGSIGDIKGHRRMFLSGLALFSSGAVVCATAPSVWSSPLRIHPSILDHTIYTKFATDLPRRSRTRESPRDMWVSQGFSS